MAFKCPGKLRKVCCNYRGLKFIIILYRKATNALWYNVCYYILLISNMSPSYSLPSSGCLKKTNKTYNKLVIYTGGTTWCNILGTPCCNTKLVYIQGIHKRMVRFQNLTRNLFLTLHGHNVHRQQRQLSKFLIRYQQFVSHAYCGASFQDGVAAGKDFLCAPF